MSNQVLRPLPGKPGYYGYVGDQGDLLRADDEQFWATAAVDILAAQRRAVTSVNATGSNRDTEFNDED